jgi:hypothetical protein
MYAYLDDKHVCIPRRENKRSYPRASNRIPVRQHEGDTERASDMYLNRRLAVIPWLSASETTEARRSYTGATLTATFWGKL